MKYFIFSLSIVLTGCTTTNVDYPATLERNLNPKYVSEESTDFCPNSAGIYVGTTTGILAGLIMPPAAIMGVLAGGMMYTANKENYDSYCIVDKKYVTEECDDTGKCERVVNIPREDFYSD